MFRLPGDGISTCDPCILFTYLVSSHTRQVTTELRLVIVTAASKHCFRGHWGWYCGWRHRILHAINDHRKRDPDCRHRTDHDVATRHQRGYLDRVPGMCQECNRLWKMLTPEQIVAGVGLGVGLQQPNVAAQTVLSDSDISIGLSLLNFVNFLGSTIFITTSQTLLETELLRSLRGIIPNLDAATLFNGGATNLRNMATEDKLPVVLAVYNNSIRSIWYLTLGLACLSFLASFGMEWKSVKAKKDETDNEVVGVTPT